MEFVNLAAFSNDLSAIFSRFLSQPVIFLKPKSSFLENDPLYFQVFILVFMTIYAYIRTKLLDNMSVVDRLWQLVPVLYGYIYLLHYYFHNDNTIHPRLLLCCGLVTLWGGRLSYNLYIKGGFDKNHEDYRWEHVRTWYNGRPMAWELFVFGFIVVYQMILIWSFIALPFYVIYKNPSNVVTEQDFALTGLFLLFLLIETIADRNMFNFQTRKQERINKRDYCQIDADFNEGFCREGLYKYSRHPNYFGELGQWFTIFLFSCANGIGFNWSILGFLQLAFIFYNSINLTEQLTSFKYPRYKYYAKGCNKLIPWFSTTKYIDEKRQ